MIRLANKDLMQRTTVERRLGVRRHIPETYNLDEVPAAIEKGTPVTRATRLAGCSGLFHASNTAVGETDMNLRPYVFALAIVATGFIAFGGINLALADCRDDMSVVQALVDQEQDATKKQQAAEELKAAQAAAQAQDEVTCKEHVERARDHLKK